jgi:hypothetical protein
MLNQEFAGFFSENFTWESGRTVPSRYASYNSHAASDLQIAKNSLTGRAKQIRESSKSLCPSEKKIPTGLYLRSNLPPCQLRNQILRKKLPTFQISCILTDPNRDYFSSGGL